MTLQEKRAKYARLAHAVQSGVKAKMEIDGSETTPKHLRVGVNMAMIDSAAVGMLLLRKGIISEEEYVDALIDRTQQEVEMYEEFLSAHYGKQIHLG